MSDDRINITVRKVTHERLRTLGAKGETFDSVITHLLDFFDKHKEIEET